MTLSLLYFLAVTSSVSSANEDIFAFPVKEPSKTKLRVYPTCWSNDCKTKLVFGQLIIRRNFTMKEYGEFQVNIESVKPKAVCVIQTMGTITFVVESVSPGKFHSLFSIYPIKYNDQLYVITIPDRAKFAALVGTKKRIIIDVFYKKAQRPVNRRITMRADVMNGEPAKAEYLTQTGDIDLQGGVIKSDEGIGVYFGENVITESVRPVSNWGRQFIIPKTPEAILDSFTFFSYGISTDVYFYTVKGRELALTVYVHPGTKTGHDTFRPSELIESLHIQSHPSPVAVVASFQGNYSETHTASLIAPMRGWKSIYKLKFLTTPQEPKTAWHMLVVFAKVADFPSLRCNDVLLESKLVSGPSPVQRSNGYASGRLKHVESTKLEASSDNIRFGVCVYGDKNDSLLYYTAAGMAQPLSMLNFAKHTSKDDDNYLPDPKEDQTPGAQTSNSKGNQTSNLKNRGFSQRQVILVGIAMMLVLVPIWMGFVMFGIPHLCAGRW